MQEQEKNTEKISDMLVLCFERQKAFQERLGLKFPEFPDYGSMDTASIALMLDGIDKNATAIIMEGAELKDWTPWKHWSVNSGNKEIKSSDFGSDAHLREMKMEVADILCFLINTAMYLGMTPQALNAIHAEKMGVNHGRQDSGNY